VHFIMAKNILTHLAHSLILCSGSVGCRDVSLLLKASFFPINVLLG